MNPSSVGLFAALGAGLISFFSPCVLPLVPAYLGYMTGNAASEMKAADRARTLAHAAVFSLGFGVAFVALGVLAGGLGSLASPFMPYLVRLGGALLVVFGLHMMGLLPWRFLYRDRRLQTGDPASQGYWGSFLVGLVFAIGWTPCVGPVLSGILLLATDAGTLTSGALLLGVYALGFALPFMLVAGLIDVLLPFMGRMGRHSALVSRIGGALLIALGVLLIGGWLQNVTAALYRLFAG